MFRRITFRFEGRQNLEMLSDFLMGEGALAVEIEEDFPVLKALLKMEASPEQWTGKALTFLDLFGEFPEISHEIVEDRDWVEVFKSYFKPFPMNKYFYIVPEWEKDRFPDQVEGRQVIVIDPGQAFGTGLHPTTSLASEFICEVSDRPFTFLDVGTGSGILSVAASKQGASEICAYDVDPLCEPSFHHHFDLNGCSEDQVTVFTGTEKDLSPGKVYDVVVINIIETIIRQVLPHLKQYVGRRLILSGIIQEHLEDFRIFLKDLGVEIIQVKEKENWVSLLCTVK